MELRGKRQTPLENNIILCNRLVYYQLHNKNNNNNNNDNNNDNNNNKI
jgi:hypothetical protein